MATAAAEPSSPIDGPSDPRTPKSPRDDGQPLPPLPPVDGPNGPNEVFDPANKERVQHVLSSDIGITTLLNRLKQSISSARDFASFLKERSVLEEKHAQGLKRLSRNTHDSIGRPENRQGSFAHNYRDITRIHDDMAGHGLYFATTLFAMSEEINELATNSEKGRKHWKQTGLNAEKRVQDAEAAMEKAKSKYNSLAEQYDRTRTGEKQGGKFGLKGPKSAAQQEEDLHRKLEAADTDYQSKVQAAQSQQRDLLTTYRPQTVHALQELINETDAGLSAQLQRFASVSEKLLLGYGLSVTPLKSQSPNLSQTSRSLREVASSINNERDFVDYVVGFTNKAGSRATDIKYEKHPSLSPKQQQHTQPTPSYNSAPTELHTPSFGTVGRQVSGVTPYQGEGYPPGGPLSQYPPGSQGPGPNYGPPQTQQPGQQMGYPPGPPPGHGQPASGPPSLPPIDASAGDRFAGQTAGVVSPTAAYRGPSAQFHNGQGQHPSSGPDHLRSPVMSVGSQSQQQQYGPQPGHPDYRHSGSQPRASLEQSSQPGPQPPSELPGFRPARGPSLGEPSDVPGGNGSPYNPASPTVAQNPGPRSPQLGQGQAPQNGAFRPPGAGPPPQSFGGPQQNTQGPRMNGLGLSQGPPQPQNGAPRPVAAGGIAALPSRAAQGGQRAGPPVKPVFGVSLDDLFHRDGSAVPTIVVQCVQAVDLYGLDVEGIYRTSGSAHHIMELRSRFDHDANSVDFRNAAAFLNDIASVTTLLKHFLRDLPDPLLTGAQYQDFIQAAKLEEDTVRRDSIHALVNALPDPNYATLRVLSLHLHRVAQHSDRNKMTNSNLAIVFAPTLMGQQGAMNGHSAGGVDIADAGWQAKVVETILNNTFQIFDDDE